MAVYKYRASIPGSKVFMREYEIKGGTSLYDLHEYLLSDLGFSPDQMVIFRGLDASDRVRSEYGLFDMGDGSMDEISVGDLLEKKETALLYVFDLHKDRCIKLVFEGEVNESPRASYPRLVAEKGRNPEQFAKGYDDFDQFIEPVDDGGDESAVEEDELPEGEEYI
jgi:hypothetical protein